MAEYNFNNGTINSPQASESGCIVNNIPYKFFRLGVENKGLLAAKGSIYVGTGETRTVTITTEGGDSYECDIPVTDKLDPPAGNGTYVLKWIKNDSFPNGKLEWVAES